MTMNGGRALDLLVPQWEPRRDGVTDYVATWGRAWSAAGFGPARAVQTSGESVSLGQGEAEASPLVSWQLTPFGWHRRGLIHSCVGALERLAGEAQRDVFVHEIWLGEKPNLPWRHRLLGWFQKASFRAAMRRWRPSTLHTSNVVYAAALKAEGWEARVVPLPSNIAITNDPAPTKRAARWADLPREVWRIVWPFSILAGWDPARLVAALETARPKGKQRVVCLSVGRQGAGAKQWDALASRAPAHWEFWQWGESEEAEVSAALLSADLGITSHSWALLGKSGGAAAMRDHGLPVLCLRAPRETRRKIEPPLPEGLQAMRWQPGEEGALREWCATVKRQAPRDRTPHLISAWHRNLP